MVDTRLKLTDRDCELSDYIQTQRRIGRRSINEQILYMLIFAAAQMSAHDLERL